MYQKAGPYIAVGIIAAWCYIFLTNAYIYHRIHTGNLSVPDTEHTYVLNGPGPQKKYVALGDSLTSGVGVHSYTESFPHRVAKLLSKEHGVELQVLAHPGLRSAGVISDYLTTTVAAKPDIVTVLIGTNDIHGRVSAREFKSNYRTILEKLRETDADVYAVSIPYIGSRTLVFPPMNFYFDWRTRHFNNIIRSLAEEYKVAYIDIAEATRQELKPDTFYSSDSFHPNALGYARWATIIYADISP